MSILKQIFSKIARLNLNSLLFPSYCALCKNDGDYLCINCESRLEKSNKNVNPWTFAYYDYTDTQVKKLLYRIKYHHNPALSRIAGSYAQKSFKSFLEQHSIKNTTEKDTKIYDYILVPIPLSKNRMSQRRYNQAYEIAVGLTGDISKVENILIRKKDTHKLHSSHTIDERSAELYDAFQIDESIIKNININNRDKADKNFSENTKYILIDDITTSGTTLFEARRTLTNHNIKKENIYAFVLAN